MTTSSDVIAGLELALASADAMIERLTGERAILRDSAKDVIQWRQMMNEEIEGCSGCKSLVKQWARECDDTDELLAMLGISETVARTEGGSLHIGKLRDLICTFQAAGQMYEAAIEEMVETLRIARECLDNNEMALCAGAIDAAMKVGAGETAVQGDMLLPANAEVTGA